MTEDERLELRLENWGRWIREKRPTGKTTSTGFDLSSPPAPDDERSAPVFIGDALVVQRAWELMPFAHHQERVEKVLMALVYSQPGRPFGAYSYYLRKVFGLRVSGPEFDDAREAARKKIVEIIKRLDGLEICA